MDQIRARVDQISQWCEDNICRESWRLYSPGDGTMFINGIGVIDRFEHCIAFDNEEDYLAFVLRWDMRA